MPNSCEGGGQGLIMEEDESGEFGGEKLGVGSLVEVRLTDIGLRGSWHPAVVLKGKPGQRLVVYEELLSDVNENQKLQETIPVGKGVDGVRASCWTQSKSSRKDRILLRPRPPKLLYPPPSSWREGLCVDVFWEDSWWEGILLENITPTKETVSVFCPDEGTVEQYAIANMRIRQEWDEETGLWTSKGFTRLFGPSFNNFCALKKLKQFADSAVKKQKFIKNGSRCRPKVLEFVETENDIISDNELLSSVLESAKRKRSPSGRSVRASHHSPQNQNASILRKRIQDEGPGCQRPLFGGAGKKGNSRFAHPRIVQELPRVTNCRVARQDLVGTAHTPHSPSMVRVKRREFEKQNAVDMKESSARISSSCRQQKESTISDCSRCVRGREELTYERVDTIVDENGPPGLQASRVTNTVESPKFEINTYKEKTATGIGSQQRKSAGESDSHETIHDMLTEGNRENEKSVRNYRKRLSGGPVRKETECRNKKSRGLLTNEVAASSKMNLPYMSPDELAKSRRDIARHKTSPAQSKFGKKKGTRGGCRMEVLLSAPGDDDISGEGGIGVGSDAVQKNILSWLIGSGALVENQKVSYLHKGKKNLGHGWVTADGVRCGCCDNVLTLSYFEAHCGSRLHKPCQNIFVDGGKSLTDLQIEVFKNENALLKAEVALSPKVLGKKRRIQKRKEKLEDGSDDTCGVCGDGGMLVCCDHCPSTFHLACMDLQEVPKDDWFCPNCRCAICGRSQYYGIEDTSNDLTLLHCDQCEREFHAKCLYDRGFPKMDYSPEKSWFCGHSCAKIHQDLRGLVGATIPLEDGFSWTLLRSQAEDLHPSSEVDKELMAEHNVKISMALSVMQECFRPMIDPRTGVDLVAHALFNRGSNVNRLNLRGFYTMILEKGDELVSVATIRVHGAALAEMPLVGTRYRYRRQGMCRRLMHAIEQMLQMVGVETLVLPAVPELLETWRGAFGFQPLDKLQKRAVIVLNLMAFPGTSLLQKSLPRWKSQSSSAENVQFVDDNDLGFSSIRSGRLSESRMDSDHSQSQSGIDEIVSVPIEGPRFHTDQDLTNSPRGEPLLSLLGKMKDDAKRSSIAWPESPTSSPPPRDVIYRKEATQYQPCGPESASFEQDETSPRKPVEKMYSTKVVVGTTRSKRLVKSTRWVADAMNKPTSGSSTVRTEASSPGRVPSPGPLVMKGSQAFVIHRMELPSASSFNTETPNPKLIIRFKLGKLRKWKKRKEEKRRKSKRSGTGNSSPLPLCDAMTAYQAPSPLLLQSPKRTADSQQIVEVGDNKVIAIATKEYSSSVERTLTGLGSTNNLQVPSECLVDIVPSQDVEGHLLVMLKHRTHLRKLLPPT